MFTNVSNRATLDIFPNFSSTISYYAGIDSGRNSDYTVITIVGSDGIVYNISRFRRIDWREIARQVGRVLNTYRPKATLIEVNGVGDVFFDLLRPIYTPMTKW